ncbi:cystathionine beta-lyase [Ochromonadaceae sp. CCMP2298]|nr:cystathionine beta-lyase [Ochromonadaceae sp. CCMP2298]
MSDDQPSKKQRFNNVSIDTAVVGNNPDQPDPYGATSIPIYQSATFAQPSATTFGDYDYSRSGNPTRSALQNQIALLEGVPGAKSFTFGTGMAAIAAISRLACAGDEVIVNDDSYGGTYRVMSKVATRMGILVKYINMAGHDGAKRLQDAISPLTRLVMIESPTNPIQRICDIRALSKVCHANTHPVGTLLSIDNTMMSPILSRPLEMGADLVMHSATKYLSGHSDTMAGVVTCRDWKEKDGKTLAESIYFYQNAEGTALAPFDCWLVLRGMKTMALRVYRQQENAVKIAKWLVDCSSVTGVMYAGLPDHPDYDIHVTQSSGGGAVVCFVTGNIALSEHLVTATKLFKITVSFGNVSSLCSMPGRMSHASIPEEVRSAREFPEDLVRLCIGIEDPDDLIQDLDAAFRSYKA